MPYATVGEVELFYTDEGDGTPVLFVHGWTCDSHDWSWQVPAFLAAGYRVVAADLRGHGRSSVPEGGYDPRTFAADLHGLLQQLGAAPAVAIGHSLGGATVSALAVEYPAAVRAIVPVDSAYGIDRALVATLGPLVDGLREQGAAAAEPLFAGFYTPASPAHLATWHRRRMHACPRHVLWQVIANLFFGPDQFGLRDESAAYLAARRCPVLSFWADPARAAWEGSLLCGAHDRVVAWEGSGHWLHQERPAEFNALVLGWLNGVLGAEA